MCDVLDCVGEQQCWWDGKKLKMIVVAAQAKPHPSVHACSVNITTGRALVDPCLDSSNPHTYRDCMYVSIYVFMYVCEQKSGGQENLIG